MAIVQLNNAKTFEIKDAMSILDAAGVAGLALDHSCRTGRCGTCKAEVLDGTTIPIRSEESLSAGDAAAGFILTCARTAETDIKLDIEDLGALANIKVKTLPSRISSIDKPAPDVVKVMLRMPPNNGFACLPGQYIDVIGKAGVRRSYSIANAVEAGGQIELHVREVEGGVLSQYWFGEAKANDLLRFEGPRGTFFMRDVTGKDVVFLATGTGIAPVKAMLEGMAASGEAAKAKSISVYWGGRVAADMYWKPEVAGVNLSFHAVLSRAGDDWGGLRGHVQDNLLHAKPDLANAVVYACGSMAMIESAKTALTAAGLPPKKFYSDAFVSSSV
ncbi:CDP-6-deoxy-delta-3,4-glucoseen reductase [soil metagenome]